MSNATKPVGTVWEFNATGKTDGPALFDVTDPSGTTRTVAAGTEGDKHTAHYVLDQPGSYRAVLRSAGDQAGSTVTAK